MTAAEAPDAIEGVGDVGRLRRAAEMLRTRASAATPGPWLATREAGMGNIVIAGREWVCEVGDQEGDVETATYITTMSPPVALALAVWLDYTASIASPEDDEFRDDGCECPYCVGIPLATKVANAILGDTP